MSCEVRIGEMREQKSADFLVTTAVSIPILGMPTLRDLGISVDCGAHELHDQNGQVVRCSVTTKSPKN